jgi:predicted ATPase
MIRKVRVKNYKSITDLDLNLGRVTVLIGANGSGKSNILEAIALASAASQWKLDNEFLTSRGIRVTDMQFMRPAFSSLPSLGDAIQISAEGDGDLTYACDLSVDESASYAKLKQGPSMRYTKAIRSDVLAWLDGADIPDWESADATATNQFAQRMISFLQQVTQKKAGILSGFLIYSPENSALRIFQSEGQILPLGIRGEGLFAHLKALDTERNRVRLARIKESLTLIEWFETFEIPDNLSPGERSIKIRDRYLPENALFDQRSANEGFLFLLFYVTLFTSPDTPAFFAIDNIDTSLNPKMCIALVQQLVALAKENDKQVILTTHNPAVLDGLDLNDDEQRLLVVERNKAGHTRVRRVEAPKLTNGQTPVSLSEAFTRGYIGGLPKNF